VSQPTALAGHLGDVDVAGQASKAENVRLLVEPEIAGRYFRALRHVW
jgi:hypothetical protein